jgi:D-2-hydroxyacid dehydrogenase (NADP+)
MTDTLRRLVVWMYSDRYPTWSMPDSTLDALRAALGPGWAVQPVDRPTFAGGDGSTTVPRDVLEAIADAEIYFGWGISRELFLAAGRLRWVHSGAAGARASLFAEMRDGDVILTNSAGIYAEPLAEWAIAAMGHFARGIDIAVSNRAGGGWPYFAMAATGNPLRELAESTVAVIGYGGIGRAIGRRAAALGMRVLAGHSRPGEPVPEEAESTFGPEELPAILGESHFVILSLPETPDTKGLIGSVELGQMRSDAVLMNLSRGGIVDEDALVETLRSGGIRGAALDVFREEPLPADSPLRDFDNVLITPHAGSVSPRFWERQTDLMVENIGHYMSGGRMRNVVDKVRGY